MHTHITEFLIPPLATYRRGAAAMCTGPIGVFWLAALVSLAYGFLGGPLDGAGVNWLLIGLGLVMWAIASTWAMLVLKGQSDDARGGPDSTEKSKIDPECYQEDPFDEVK